MEHPHGARRFTSHTQTGRQRRSCQPAPGQPGKDLQAISVPLGVLQVAHVPRSWADRPRPFGAAPKWTVRPPRFTAGSDGVYGAPRILADLRADGQRVSRKTVAASLRRQGLAGICPRRFAPATTVVDLAAAVPKDLVGRILTPDACTGVDVRHHVFAHG